VILHGMDESWRTFGQLAPRFAESRDVYAVDLRGHGDSDKPEAGYSLGEYAADVLALLPQLGGPIDLLGHSLGSLVALLGAHAQPEAVAHLVLEDPPIVLRGDEAVIRSIATESRALKQQQSLPAAIDAIAPAHASYPRAWIEMNARDILATAPASWDGLLEWSDDPLDWETLLPPIAVPTLVLAPERTASEGWFTGERRALFERLLPSARIVTFPVNAHHLSVHAPDAYVAEVESFLREAR
jgi:pimeloyl-ACP methyl ester carboxylesterase